MTKVNFFRKAHKDDLIPRDTVNIEKVVIIEINEFRKFENRLLDNYDFIAENIFEIKMEKINPTENANEILQFIGDKGISNKKNISLQQINLH